MATKGGKGSGKGRSGKGQSAANKPGDLRMSQVITSYGPGSMVDLPEASVLISGLDDWSGEQRLISEDRLERRVAEVLQLGRIELREPPLDPPGAQEPTSGLTAYLFPLWFVAQYEKTETYRGKQYRARPLVHWRELQGGQYYGPDRKKYKVVPVRFVQACPRGHITDFDWRYFSNRQPTTNWEQLWLWEGGSGSDLQEIFVVGEHTRRPRSLGEAAQQGSPVLGRCQGRKPWLGPYECEECAENNRLLVRSASNAYFAQTLSVISIPDQDMILRERVAKVYDQVMNFTFELFKMVRPLQEQLRVGLEGFSDEQVWQEVERRKRGQEETRRSIKQLEFETMAAQREEGTEDLSAREQGDFFARARRLEHLSARLSGRLERVVLVHRLREVVAQVGFTRFEPALPDVNGELDLQVVVAPLARVTKVVPAVEHHGEGVFLQFSEAAIEAWMARPAVVARGDELVEGFNQWKARSEQKPREDGKGARFPGLPYVLLHSIAHLLITQVSLECGYAASAIRERIYALEEGYAILLYTGSPGSEGTLGGLIKVGRKIEDYLERALEEAGLCSNDPICAQHTPKAVQEERYLHGAACHGCLLIAEPSCERQNSLLDRALVVPVIGHQDTAFFSP